jgi:molecular chaperone GrpE
MAPRKKSIKKSDGGVELLKNQLARVLADYDNLTKRVEREREEFGKLANARLIIKLLSIYDMLEGAQLHLKDSGLAITIEEFVKVLEDEEFEKIKTNVGDKFDEEIHEAVEVIIPQADGKDKVGTIAEVILTGWKVKEGSVVRPAKVKVYKKT